jgi:cyclophilin family peptidyl-prolyl cis-trans isomerase
MPARHLLPLALALLALALAACGGDEKKASAAKATATAAQTTEPSAGDETGCKAAKPTAEKVPKPARPKGALDPKKSYVVTVDTNCGSFKIKLAVKQAPKTSASFASLVKQGFFDGLTFHRIVPGFVIQGGDPEGKGTGGPGYSVKETPPSKLSYTRGVVAMAKSGAESAGTSGSQFFVVTAEDAGLPPDYALVGRVSEGEDVVDSIGVVPTRPDEQPVDPVVISKMTVSAS